MKKSFKVLARKLLFLRMLGFAFLKNPCGKCVGPASINFFLTMILCYSSSILYQMGLIITSFVRRKMGFVSNSKRMAQMTYLVVNFFLDGNLGFLSFDSDSSISVTLCGSMEQSVFPKRYISPYLPCSSLKFLIVTSSFFVPIYIYFMLSA